MRLASTLRDNRPLQSKCISLLIEFYRWAQVLNLLPRERFEQFGNQKWLYFELYNKSSTFHRHCLPSVTLGRVWISGLSSESSGPVARNLTRLYQRLFKWQAAKFAIWSLKQTIFSSLTRRISTNWPSYRSSLSLKLNNSFLFIFHY